MLLFVLLLYISFVSAVITVESASGRSGLENYRSANDTIIINVTSQSNVSIGSSPCTFVSGNSYICAFTDLANSPSISYTLRNDDAESASASFNVDNGIGTVSYIISNVGNSPVLNYTIEDTGFNDDSVCSGISSIKVFDGASMINAMDLNGTPGTCVYTGSLNLSITSSGSRIISFKAIDNVGNSKDAEPQNITIDLNAPEVQHSLKITESGKSDELSTIGKSATFLVDVYFSIKEDNLASVTADLSSINYNPAMQYMYKNVNVPLSDCLPSSVNTSVGKGVYDCVIRGVSMQIPDNSNSVSINVTAVDQSGNVGSGAVVTNTFTIDSIIPAAVIQTDHCDTKGRCFIKNGVNKIIVKLSKQNFNQLYVFFNLEGSAFGINRVQNCTGGDCYAYVSVTCTTGAVDASITSLNGIDSQDDSGNVIPYYSTSLYCDNNAPVIMDAVLTGDNSATQLPSNVLISGKRITLTATINELESDDITAYANLTDITSISKVDKLADSLTKGTCKRSNPGDQNMTCTFVLDTVNDGKAHDVNINLNVTDAAGNFYSMKLPTKTILGLKDSNETTPQFLKGSIGTIRPSQVDRITLDLAQFNKVNYYVFADYKLNLAYGTGIRLLYQKLDISDCMYIVDGESPESASEFFQTAKISDIYSNISVQNRIDFVFRSPINANQIANNFVLSCNISAYIQENDYMYNKPQILNIQIPMSMRNSKLDTPGEEFAKKIKDTQDSVNNNDLYKMTKTLDKAMATTQKLCDMKRYVDYAQMAGTAMQIAGSAIPFLPGVSQSLSSTGSYMDGTAGTIQDKVWGQPSLSSAWGIAGQACAFVSCNMEWNKDVTFGLDSSIAGPLNDLGKGLDKEVPIGLGKELTSNLQNSDLKNSIVMSSAKLCLPGIVYNLNKYRQVDCEYLQCLKVYSATGLDVSQCDNLKSSKVCSIVVGEAFELPFVRVGKNLFGNTADVIRTLYGTGFNQALKLLKTSGCENNRFKTDGTPYSTAELITCRIPNAVQQYISYQKASAKAGDFHYDQTQDFCDTASCVGASCLTTQATFGAGLPPLTVSADQQARLNLQEQLGDANANVARAMTTTLVSAFHASDDAERAKQIAEYNKEVPAGLQITATKDVWADRQTIKDRFTAYEALNKKKLDITPANVLLSTAQSNYDSVSQDYNTLISQLSISSNTIQEKVLQKYTYTEILHADIDNFKTAAQTQHAAQIANIKSMLGPNAVVYDNAESLQQALLVKMVKGDNTAVDSSKLFYFNDEGRLVQADGDIVLKNSGLASSTNYVLDKDSQGNPVCRGASTELCKKYDAVVANVKKAQQPLTDAQYKLKVETINSRVDFGVRLLFDTFGFKKFLTAEYWQDKWGVGKYITEVADAVDPAKWKNNLCNPFGSHLFTGESSGSGTVYQCANTGNGCRLVLSFGAERVQYNDTYYIYTLTYIVGPVSKDTQFNILLNGQGVLGGNTIKGFTNNMLLSTGHAAQNSRIIVTDKQYDQMCFQFTSGFPTSTDDMSYCRDIKDNTFNTGNPYTAQDITNAAGGGATTLSSGKGFMEQ